MKTYADNGRGKNQLNENNEYNRQVTQTLENGTESLVFVGPGNHNERR